jgi:hypothetical protein
MDAAMKEAIVEFIKKKTERGKGLHAMRDITKGCSDFEKRDVKKGVQELIAEGVLDYWSSGSTTYIRLSTYEPGEEGLVHDDDE